MTLVLQIENYDYLEDGGPIRFTVGPRGCQVGRSSGMDWVLPDPSRHISGHHFDILPRDGAYWLVDVSTNGTFLQGQRYRLDGAHQLAHMDRIQVGQYIIVALMQAEAVQSRPAAPLADGWGGSTTAAPQHMGARDADPWSLGPALTPIDPRPRTTAPRREDFADDFISAPSYMPDREPPADLPPAALTPAALPPQFQPKPQPEVAPASQPGAVPLPAPGAVPPPSAAPMPTPGADLDGPALSPALSPATRPDPGLIARPAPIVPAAMPGAQQAGASDFVRAFCEGAGLPSAGYDDIDPTALAHALGQTMRVVARETMGQLQARASVKQFTRGGERTMRQATDNNPLKFLPDADQALEAMFLKFRAGFLTGPDSLTEALRDIRVHQIAVFAAIQPALGTLLGDLAPEQIEAAAGGGGLLAGGRKAKAWDAFVARWDAKTHPHENGILDEFLAHFARAYADCVASNAP